MRLPSASLLCILAMWALCTVFNPLGLSSPQSADAKTHSQNGKSTQPEQKSIGVATMDKDGTITLRLLAEGPGNATGEGLMVYPKSHPEYKKILKHIGRLRPGESKPVRPWPDEKAK